MTTPFVRASRAKDQMHLNCYLHRGFHHFWFYIHFDFLYSESIMPTFVNGIIINKWKWNSNEIVLRFFELNFETMTSSLRAREIRLGMQIHKWSLVQLQRTHCRISRILNKTRTCFAARLFGARGQINHDIFSRLYFFFFHNAMERRS